MSTRVEGNWRGTQRWLDPLEPSSGKESVHKGKEAHNAYWSSLVVRQLWL